MKNVIPGFYRGIRHSFAFILACFTCLNYSYSANKTLEKYIDSTQLESIDLMLQENNLEKTFQLIESKTSLKFSYDKKDLDNNLKLTKTFKKAPLNQVLSYISSISGLEFKIIGKTINVVKGDSNNKRAPQRKINGTVLDPNGTPIPGANVVEVGTTNGVATDFDGKFEIDLITAEPKIRVSYVGFKAIEMEIGEAATYEITLQESAEALDEVVVVGFGEQKKVSVVGAVTAIKPEEMKIPSSSLSQSFAGRLSGVIAVQRSGEPGRDAAQFWIRGISTFGNTNPLVFMDGIEISLGDLNSIDPTNIQNFSILKDASATAIYGARGANGVILIETKRGMEGKPRINVTVENSFISPTQYPEFTDAVTFMNMYNEARKNQNPFQPPKFSEDKIQGTREARDPYIYPNVDWLDELFSDFSIRKYGNLNIRGGGQTARYYMSASIFHDKGILKETDVNDFDNNIDQKRYNFVNNISVNVTPTTELELNLNADLINYNGPAVDASNIFGNIMNSNPVRFPVTYPTPEGSGHIYFGNTTGGFGPYNTFPNPYADLVKGYKERFSSTFISTFRIRQQLDMITKGLSFKAFASFKNWTSSEITRSYEPYFYQLDGYQYDPQTDTYEYELSQIGQGGRESLAQSGSNNGDRSFMTQAALNYNRTFGKHDVSGLLVYLQRQYNVNVIGSDLTSSLPSRNQGVSGRLTYAYDDRYLAEVNFGYNGSENFAEGKRFGFFPSFAMGYVISNEPYFKSLKKSISLFKLRASYGESGNDRIGAVRFPYTSNVNLGADNGFTFGQNFNNSRPGVAITRYENNSITWEVGKKINVGLDLGLFDKVTLNVDVFKERREGIFMQRNTIPGTIGIGDTKPYANLGEVENKGVDVSLSYNQSFGSDLIVSSRGTFTFAQNKILAMDEPNLKYSYLSRVGRPVNQLWGLQAERLFIDQAEIDNSPTQTYTTQYYPGDLKYTDISNEIDGQNKIDANDRTPMGHPSVPEITYGYGINVMYKKFDFGVLFQGIARVSFFMSGLQPFAQNERNVLQAIANDYWTEDNQNLYAFYPRLSESENPNNVQNSSWWLRDGSFMRLKSAEIGFQYNRQVRFYVNGVNLLTFSKFNLWDPEMGGGNGLGYPPQRTFNLGAQINL
ncbi:TonB-linked outer membrane protein, SusC/RagA family [Zhouia amylolytica]|uniref:TonB-linked outer membrane protein, SusC/RagA family n=1 Tax=Zhouia amylolytica TaxID=376730 RepID=A0A1I6NYI7_9FLAO|nr:TonB-dependent receptor [Zhouia amylolytica]SFS33032.1 TonB-linked outer membrane protein, SusC/RagA family [Zhouia amylolytica]